MIRFLWFLIAMVRLLGVHPEDQIIILDGFISPEVSQALIQHFDAEKKNLTRYSDNELSLDSISHPRIRKLLLNITNRILQLMKQHYPLGNTVYVLDHGGLYARIPKNFCPYHADNLYFDCPLHGRDQNRLRTICPGNCYGSKYVPNHTYWREYTALIYLNDGFTGGELAFEDGPSNKLYKKIIPIQANMLVLVPCGQNFYHEVYPIQTGKRYSLHLWFTSDPEMRRSRK